MIQIDRCYCFQVRFSEMKEVADEEGARSVQELQEHIEFGRQCRLCHPYVRQMLRTGETVFTEIITEGDEV